MTRLGGDDAGYRIELPDRPGEYVALSFAAVSDVGRRHSYRNANTGLTRVARLAGT